MKKFSSRPQDGGATIGLQSGTVPLGPAQHVWDGRLLDGDQAEAPVGGKKAGQQSDSTQAMLFRRPSVKDPSEHATMAKGMKHSGQALSGHAVSKAHEQVPMTPPRVSGISMAPVPCDFSFPEVPPAGAAGGHAPAQKQQAQRLSGIEAAGAAGGKAAALGKRQVTLKITVPAGALPAGPAGEVGGAAAHGGSHHAHQAGRVGIAAQTLANAGSSGTALTAEILQGSGGSGGVRAEQLQHVPQFVAEGRAVTLARALGGPNSSDAADGARLESPLNPNLAYYREINDADSLCGTPPTLSISTLTREFDAMQPLGPLSPSPLSPSILTLCGVPGEMGDGGGEGGGGPNVDGADGSRGSVHLAVARLSMWGSHGFDDLPDMRMDVGSPPISPYLQLCDSPGLP